VFDQIFPGFFQVAQLLMIEGDANSDWPMSGYD
jgi:hypothetical protein